MEQKTCCFAGHRRLPIEEIPYIKERLKQEIEAMVLLGVTIFLSGGAAGFDMLAAEVVNSLKQTYPQLRLIFVLPYEKAETKIHGFQADGDVVLSVNYYRGCMHTRNRFMVDHSAWCIAYLRADSGGTKYTVDLAKKKGIKLIQI